jgi:hypothetical protein
VRRLSLRLVISFAAFAFALAVSTSAANNPVPFLNPTLSPTSVAPGAASFTLTVTGNQFVSGATVEWNGSPLTTTFVSAFELTATVPAASVANPGTATISVLNPTPAGGTSAPAYFFIHASHPTVAYGAQTQLGGKNLMRNAATFADVNGDGLPDLVAIDNFGDIEVFQGYPDGTFGAPVSTTTSGLNGLNPVIQVLVRDVNGDGKPDLLVTALDNSGGRSLFVFPGYGNNTFEGGGPGTSGTPPAPTSNVSLIGNSADFNGDGKLDLLIVDFSGNVRVLLGNGDGTFTTGPVLLATPISAYPFMGVADINGDGIPDVIVGTPGSQGGYVLQSALGNGDGTFAAFTTIGSDTTDGLPQFTMALGDLNNDGKTDIVVLESTPFNSQTPNPGASALTAYLGDGTGSFAAQSPVLGSSPGPVALADVNNDGNVDVYVGNGVYYGKGDGTVDGGFAFGVYGTALSLVQILDINQDGLPDVLYQTNSGVFVFEQYPLLTGDFTASFNTTSQNVAAGSSITFTGTLVPLNGFVGKVDVTSAMAPSSSISVGNTSQVNGPNEGTTITVQVTVPASQAAGTYTITMIGTSETNPPVSHQAVLTLNVQPQQPDFTGSVTNASQLVNSGQTASYGVNVNPIDGFTGTVTLSVGTLPPGVTANFVGNPITGGSGSATLNLVTSASTPTGRYPIDLTGTSGSLSHSTGLILSVNSDADFTGGVGPSVQTISAGGSTSFTGSISPLNGFTGSVALSVSGLPAGATAGFTPATVTGGSGPFTLNVSTTSGVASGNYPLTVTGTSGTLTHSASVTLNIN